MKQNDHMIISVMKCQKPSPDCYDMINQSWEEATERSTTVTSSTSARRRSSTMLRNCYLKIGYELWQKEVERRKDFNIARIQALPNKSCTFQQFTDIQETMLDPTLQDNVLLPKGFTEYNYHVGNANESNSKVRNGLIPEGTSLKRGRQAVIFKTVNTMEDVYGMGETPWRSFETKDRAIQ